MSSLSVSIIPRRIDQFSSDHWSQTTTGRVSTYMGDRLGIPCVLSTLLFWLIDKKNKTCKILGKHTEVDLIFTEVNSFFAHFYVCIAREQGSAKVSSTLVQVIKLSFSFDNFLILVQVIKIKKFWFDLGSSYRLILVQVFKLSKI